MNVRRTEMSQISELSRFLADGRRTQNHQSEQALRWKYFVDENLCRSFVACNTASEIIGHIGICMRNFQLVGLSKPMTTTAHFIDWRANGDYPLVGLGLMRDGFALAETQYGLGGTEIGQRMARRVGFVERTYVSSYCKVLNPLYPFWWLLKSIRTKNLSAAKSKFLSAIGNRPRSACLRVPAPNVAASSVNLFGSEVESILKTSELDVVFTDRSPEILNYYLQCPITQFHGWLLREDGELVGFAITNTLRRGRMREGRIIECFLTRSDIVLWNAAITALMNVLPRVDHVSALSSSPWMSTALRENGFVETRRVPLLVRDQDTRLTDDFVFHVGYLEADLAYL